jgi:hypothetical protein
MPSFDYDLRYLQAGIDQLESYLLAKDLYWPVGISAASNETPYPQLTISGLLLSLQRLRAAARTPEQQSTSDEIERKLDEIRTRWRVAWEKKAIQDYRARLNLWRDFLEDYRDRPSAHYDRYPYEVGRRVQLELLRGSSGEIPAAEEQLLNGLDGLLRSVFTPGQFVWEEYLAPSFPQQPFWYLYGSIKKEINT